MAEKQLLGPSYAEQETSILFNRADSQDGYFYVYTSIKSHYDKICERYAGIEGFSATLVNGPNSRFWGANFKIPSRYFSSTTFGLKTPVKPSAARLKSLAKAREQRHG